PDQLPALLDRHLGRERSDLGQLLVADLLEQRDRLKPVGVQPCVLLARGWGYSTRTIHGRVVMVSRYLSGALLRMLRQGRVEVAGAHGRRHYGPPDADLRATVRLHDDGFLRALPHGSLALAEAYIDGAWDSDQLVQLVRIGARELPRVQRLRRPF